VTPFHIERRDSHRTRPPGHRKQRRCLLGLHRGREPITVDQRRASIAAHIFHWAGISIGWASRCLCVLPDVGTILIPPGNPAHGCTPRCDESSVSGEKAGARTSHRSKRAKVMQPLFDRLSGSGFLVHDGNGFEHSLAEFRGGAGHGPRAKSVATYDLQHLRLEYLISTRPHKSARVAWIRPRQR
jgi:hypothetical protein